MFATIEQQVLSAGDDGRRDPNSKCQHVEDEPECHDRAFSAVTVFTYVAGAKRFGQP